MITFLNNVHHVHQGRQEMFRGQMVPCFEVPARVDRVLEHVLRRGLGPVEPPGALEGRALEAVHTPLYLEFLRNAWADWVAMDASNASRDALPSVWPNQGLRSDVLPANFAARMGRFAFDSGSPLTAGTWEAARQGAACAVSAARAAGTGMVTGVPACFALRCEPVWGGPPLRPCRAPPAAPTPPRQSRFRVRWE